MENKENKDNYILENSFSKSNFLISAKFDSSILENQILALAITRMQYKKNTDKLETSFYANELKSIFGKDYKSFYHSLKTTAAAMTGRVIGMVDAENESFTFFSLVSKATYSDGIFTITFNREMKSYLTNLHDNFTKLKLNIMLSFNTVAAFRLYEYVKSCMYYTKDYAGIKDGKFTSTVNVYELRFMLGSANAEENDDVRSLLQGRAEPDYEKAISYCKKIKYPRFTQFKENFIDKAVTEINNNELSDIYIEEVTPNKYGNTYKTVTFKLFDKKYHKEQREEIIDVEAHVEDLPSNNLTQAEKAELEFQVRFDGTQKFGMLSGPDSVLLLETAGWDINKVKAAFDCLEGYLKNNEVDNKMGFLLRAIQNGYSTEKIINKSKKNKKLVNDFNSMKMQSDSYKDEYIDEEFEKSILSN